MARTSRTKGPRTNHSPATQLTPSSAGVPRRGSTSVITTSAYAGPNSAATPGAAARPAPPAQRPPESSTPLAYGPASAGAGRTRGLRSLDRMRSCSKQHFEGRYSSGLMMGARRKCSSIFSTEAQTSTYATLARCPRRAARAHALHGALSVWMARGRRCLTVRELRRCTTRRALGGSWTSKHCSSTGQTP